MTFLNKFSFTFLSFCFALSISAQTDSIDFSIPAEYTVGNIAITGNDQTDAGIIKVLSGISSGEKSG
jgi:hypothetical protein